MCFWLPNIYDHRVKQKGQLYIYMSTKMKAEVLVILFAFLHFGVCEEPHCSKFHYEEQTLLKILKLEINMDKILTDFDNLQSELADKVLRLQSDINKYSTLLQEMGNQVTHLANKQSVSTYARWGREDCPGNGTELLYKGYMAGNKWDKYGSGTTSLCLPDVPTWAEHIDGYQSGATIYGTEIEIDGTVSAKLFGFAVSNNDISCAMCASVRSSMIMLPGHSKCLPGWAEEYKGYLVASHPDWKGSSDYVCLDANFLKGQDGANDNHVIRIVEAECGSLPCPPYVQGREIACVVCTK